MSSCETFHARFEPGSEDPGVLEHLRSCDSCLDMAAHVDPDVMFRALGGDMIPPGGVDAFADEVMRAIHVRDAERRLAPVRILAWPGRMAVAAMLVAGFLGVLVLSPPDPAVAPTQPPALVAVAQPLKLATKPVVETYEAENATIVEVPTDGADDTRIVMVFDESLPADL